MPMMKKNDRHLGTVGAAVSLRNAAQLIARAQLALYEKNQFLKKIRVTNHLPVPPAPQGFRVHQGAPAVHPELVCHLREAPEGKRVPLVSQALLATKALQAETDLLDHLDPQVLQEVLLLAILPE
jgi:hypothetical protein